MPTNKYKCDKEVKDHFKHIHSKCETTKRKPKVTNGLFLNRFIHGRPFLQNKNYQICHTLHRIINCNNIKPLTQEERDEYNKQSLISLQRDSAIVVPTVSPSEVIDEQIHQITTDRESRLARRTLQRDHHDNKEQQENDESENNDCPPTIHETPPPTKLPQYTKFDVKINEYSSKYRLPFKELKWKQRIARIDECVALIIGSCIDKKEMKEKGGLGYIEKNDEFANECMNIVSGIRERLGKKLKVELINSEIDVIEAIPLVENDEENKDEQFDMDTAMVILGESTGRGYKRIRKQINNKFGHEEANLPSAYKIDKQLPLKVENVSFKYADGNYNNHGSNTAAEYNDREDLLYGDSSKPLKSELDALQVFSVDADGSNEVFGSKLEGGMEDWIEAMLKKFDCKRYTVEDGDDLILINSFDGAEAIKTEKELKSVISFSSQILTPRLIQSGTLQAGSSFNILTWMQLIGKEELKVLRPCMSEYLSIRRELVEGRIKSPSFPSSKIWTYDVHDGKMLYLLTQHSQWNRKNHPFMMCDCKRGDAISNANHVCTMWNDINYSKKWNTSLRKWDAMTALQQDWTVKKHRDWCDERNSGITHLGFDPEFLPMSTIRFDTFHLSCAVIRKLMNCLRLFVLKQSSNFIKSFTNEVLRSFMTDFLVYCWNNKLKFSVFKGNDLFTFVSYNNKIIEFLQEHLTQTDELKNICLGLRQIRPIIKFMTKTYIKTEDDYKKDLSFFKKDLEVFYEAGKGTYFRKEADESFYMHCLRFYMPKIAEITFDRHKLGLGIFTMQGFERRNKESKNTIKRFSTTNRKSKSLMKNNLKRLLMVFINEMNSY